jgi:hypothetical protein
MTKLWVKWNSNRATQVPTEGCENVDAFLKVVKNELSNKLGSYDSDQLFLSLADGGDALDSGDPLPAQNTSKTPLFIFAKCQGT